MAWTAPATWTANQLIGASDLNTQVRDNLNYLLGGRTIGSKTSAVSASTSSTTFVDIDATNLIITQTLTSTRALCVLVAPMYQNTAGSYVYFDFVVDSTSRIGGTNGIFGFSPAAAGGYYMPGVVVGIFTGLTAASHTFKPQWKVSANVGGLIGTSGVAQFYVLEI